MKGPLSRRAARVDLPREGGGKNVQDPREGGGKNVRDPREGEVKRKSIPGVA